MVTIQQVLRPLLIMYFIVGLGAYPMKQPNSKIAYLSILYRLIIWFSYVYLFYYIIMLFTWKVLCPDMISKIIMVINMSTTIICVIMSFCHQKRFEITLKKLSTFDNSLKELGIPLTYERIHTYLKLTIIGWIVYSLTINFLETVYYITFDETTYWGLFLSHILNYCVHINAFVDLLFTFFLWYICTRFDKINEYIRRLLATEDHGLRCTWKISKVTNQYTLCTDYKHALWTTMHLYLELCRIAHELNFIFGTQITFVMAECLIFITTLCYSLCVLLTQNLPKEILQSPHIWFNINLWFFGLLIRVFAINYICENIMIKANEINKIILQLTNTHRYADVRKEIYQFNLQVIHHPLKLTGMNLFYFGNECLRKLCTTTAMYVIIMVQMKIRINFFE